MDCATTADCVKKLKTHGSKLHTVEVSDGNEKTILGMPTKRHKWKTLERQLDDLGWREARAKDKAGSVIGIYTADGDDDEEFVDNVQLPEDMAAMLLFAEKVCAMVLSGQQVALKAQERQSKSLMEGHAALAKVLTDRLVALERMYAANLRIAQNAVEQTGDGDEGLLSGPALAVLLPEILRGHYAQKAAAAAANGVKK